MVFTAILWLGCEVFANMDAETLDSILDKKHPHPEFSDNFIRWLHGMHQFEIEFMRPYFVLGMMPYVNVLFYMSLPFMKKMPPFL